MSTLVRVSSLPGARARLHTWGQRAATWTRQFTVRVLTLTRDTRSLTSSPFSSDKRNIETSFLAK